MITLYRAAECTACDDVQATLQELVVAHKVVDVEEGESSVPDKVRRNREWPVITDGDQVESGQVALQAYLAELTREIEQWRKFQTDACYIDDEGKTC